VGLLIFVVFAVLAAGAVAYAVSATIRGVGGVRAGGIVAAIPLAIIAFLSLGITQIEAGHLGVVRQFGAVTGEVLAPGLTWRVPFATSVDDVNTQVRQIRIADDPDTPQSEDYQAASKEQQDLFLRLTLNYHVDPQRAPEIIQNIGPDFEAKIVLPRLQDIPKSITDDYATAIVLNSRDEIRQKATDALRDALAPFGFIVDNIAIENFSYSPEYNAAIEQKQVAQQQVEIERQKVLSQQQIAEQRVAEARGLADAQIERARGEAESNRLVAESLTEEILTNRYIEKLAPGVQTILVPSDNGLFLNLGGSIIPTPTGQPQ
jgi:prohibitin 2